MGSRRIGRKRLYALSKAGEALTSTAGAAMEGNIGSQTRLRDGEIIATDITIDLASSAGAAHSFSVASANVNIGTTAIGVSSSSGVHGNAQVMLINKVGDDADSIGVLTGGELMCVETPVGGGEHIGLWYGTNVTASGADMTSGTVLAAVGPRVIGSSEALDPDIDLDNKYLYLVHSGSGADNYSAGKFVIRLYGYNVFDDV
jgi:hypothetical protein